MKNWKQFWALALAVLLALSVSIPAFAAVNDTGFSDVDAGAWYAEAVAYVREHGIMNGTTETTFNPDATTTRGQMAAILYRAVGSPAASGLAGFSDVADSAYYAQAVRWANANGIITGYEDGTFRASQPVTRQQMTAILWRYAGSPAAAAANISDASSVSSYAADAVNWAVGSNIVAPVSGNTFAPHSSATRAQIAAAVMNLNRNTQTANPTPDTSSGSRVLVAYFSRYGNTDYASDVDATTSASVVVEDGRRQGATERIARMIAQQTGGDLHLIETVESYPTDFNDVVSQNHEEIANGVRPALTSYADLDNYDVIFVGYPVWSSTAPTPVLSFLEHQSLSGKTVIPFCTHDGYGAGSSYSAIRGSSSGATVEQGLAVDSDQIAVAQSTVTDWVNGLNLSGAGTASNSPASRGETAIRITVEGQTLEGVLYDGGMARQFLAQLPQIITMSNYGGREVYGSIEQAITAEGEGQLRFDDGDITYCPSNNTAAIFYSQSSQPNLTMRVYPIGKVTSDLSIFPSLPSRVEITFEAA